MNENVEVLARARQFEAAERAPFKVHAAVDGAIERHGYEVEDWMRDTMIARVWSGFKARESWRGEPSLQELWELAEATVGICLVQAATGRLERIVVQPKRTRLS